MDLHSIKFDQLPFTKLFQDYTASKKSILSFFEGDPFETESYSKRTENISANRNRRKIAELLRDYNSQFTGSKQVFDQISQLEKPDSLVIVTGQQVALYGGPMYTIYKTITTILYAQKLSERLERPVIPVFWLADEDHDFDEVNSISLPLNGTHEQFKYTDQSGETRAASVAFNSTIKEFNDRCFSTLADTDFTEYLKKPICSFYKSGETFGSSFGKWLLHLFGDKGLILAGSNHPGIKEEVKHIFSESVSSQKQIEEILNATTSGLNAQGYHGQVQVQSSNLFIIDPDGSRKKLNYEKNTWNTGEIKWTTQELLNEIDNKPDKFSPNVFLRPILQDALLPVLAYTGGPGETAYFAQMKDLYRIFNLKMPLVLPRYSITLIESSVNRIMEKLPFGFTEYHNRIEDLEKEFVKQTETKDLEKLFSEWKNSLKELTKEQKKEIEEIDPSLAPSAGKAKAVYFTELDKLKGKLYRSVKEQEKTQIKRISRIKNHLFPDQGLQERKTAFIFYMNKYGPEIWDQISLTLENELPNTHKLIEI